jgi:hypothetical protein
MSILDSIKHDLIGVAIVASALVLFSLLIKLTLSFKSGTREKKNRDFGAGHAIRDRECPADDQAVKRRRLKLVNVDEKTPRLSWPSQPRIRIPLSELRFKKIRC